MVQHKVMLALNLCHQDKGTEFSSLPDGSPIASVPDLDLTARSGFICFQILEILRKCALEFVLYSCMKVAINYNLPSFW